MLNKPVVFWIVLWATWYRHFYGKKSHVDYQPGECNRLLCDWWLNVKEKFVHLFLKNIGLYLPILMLAKNNKSRLKLKNRVVKLLNLLTKRKPMRPLPCCKKPN